VRRLTRRGAHSGDGRMTIERVGRRRRPRAEGMVTVEGRSHRACKSSDPRGETGKGQDRHRPQCMKQTKKDWQVTRHRLGFEIVRRMDGPRRTAAAEAMPRAHLSKRDGVSANLVDGQAYRDREGDDSRRVQAQRRRSSNVN